MNYLAKLFQQGPEATAAAEAPLVSAADAAAIAEVKAQAADGFGAVVVGDRVAIHDPREGHWITGRVEAKAGNEICLWGPDGLNVARRGGGLLFFVIRILVGMGPAAAGWLATAAAAALLTGCAAGPDISLTISPAQRAASLSAQYHWPAPAGKEPVPNPNANP